MISRGWQTLLCMRVAGVHSPRVSGVQRETWPVAPFRVADSKKAANRPLKE